MTTTLHHHEHKRYTQEGLAEGITEGERRGHRQGYRMGYQRSLELGLEVGQYLGFAEEILAEYGGGSGGITTTTSTTPTSTTPTATPPTTTPTTTSTPARMQRILAVARSLVDASQAIPLENDPNASMVDQLQRIRAKFKLLQSLLGGSSGSASTSGSTKESINF